MAPRASFPGVCLPPQQITNASIEEIPLPQRVVLPLGQDAANVCQPLVEVGDQVHTGQLLGQSSSFHTAPVHSSVSGRVVDIRPWFDQKGDKVPAVIIESDGNDSWQEATQADERFLEKDSGLILADLKASGVVSSGPPVMPLHAKLGRAEPSREFLFLVGTPPAEPVDTLIINGIDAEPGMALRRGVLQAYESEITAGIRILLKLLPEAKVVLAVGANGSFSPAIADGLTELGVQVFRAKNKYPVGLNPMLIKCVTGREIPLPEGSESDIGVAVVDVVSLVHLVEAVRDQKPQVEKVVSVSGAGIGPTRNVKVRLGTVIKDLMQQLGIKDDEPVKVIAGGAMTGYALFSTDMPVSKETDALIFQTTAEAKSFSPDPCISCGMCARHCPARLLPNELAKYCEFGMFEEARDKFLLHCIECGICAYVCPEKRPMLHLMRYGKRELSLG
jgi:electron transport complex protein RnfC